MVSFPTLPLLLPLATLLFGGGSTTLLYSTTVAVAAAAASPATTIGQPHSTVQTLTSTNINTHLSDTANPLWLLKFYAPWCGHCKSLSPILDTAAKQLVGKLSIGKIDCTSEKQLCQTHDIKGYPTLKYVRNGEYYDYPLGRDLQSIVMFGNKMSKSPVRVVRDVGRLFDELLGDDDDDDSSDDEEYSAAVAYVVYDPTQQQQQQDEDDKLIQSTELTRVFGQVAQKFQAHGTFGLLPSNIPREHVAQILGGSKDNNIIPSTGFIARIEEDVPTKFFVPEEQAEGNVSIEEALVEYIKETNIPMLVELGGHNFRFASRRGKPLVIGVYNPEDTIKTTQFRKEMKLYAVHGQHSTDYVFGTMDGKKWDKFTSQFGITHESLPEVFILDAPERTYWQDSSVFDISDFINSVQKGEIEPRVQERSGPKNPLEEFSQMFVAWMPWSLMAMLTLFVVVFWLALPSSEPLLPPAPEPVDGASKKKKDGDDDEKEDKEEETKKEK
jgi:protein disulfide-isomerase-like protein